MTWFHPKDFQQDALGVLGAYCAKVRRCGEDNVRRPDRDAFEETTGRGYFTALGFDGVPYVCVRIPTGGGKTLLAALVIGAISHKLLGVDSPTCLWITPSTTIRDQTLRALKNVRSPLRRALEDNLRSDVEVVTLEDGNGASRPDVRLACARRATFLPVPRLKRKRRSARRFPAPATGGRMGGKRSARGRRAHGFGASRKNIFRRAKHLSDGTYGEGREKKLIHLLAAFSVIVYTNGYKCASRQGGVPSTG